MTTRNCSSSAGLGPLASVSWDLEFFCFGAAGASVVRFSLGSMNAGPCKFGYRLGIGIAPAAPRGAGT